MNETAATAAKAPESGLPLWNLADLYPGPDSPALKADLESAEKSARAFELAYKGKLAALSGAEFGRAIAAYETIDETLARLGSYAQLLFSCDMATPETARFYQGIQERTTDISTRTLFFTLEINRLDDAVLDKLLKAPEAARYAPWLRDVRLFKPHQLSDEAEKLLHEKYIAGRAAWTRLFDETMAALRFEVDGKELIETEVLHLLSDKNEETRRKAALSLGQVLGQNNRTFALITNTLAKDTPGTPVIRPTVWAMNAAVISWLTRMNRMPRRSKASMAVKI